MSGNVSYIHKDNWELSFEVFEVVVADLVEDLANGEICYCEFMNTLAIAGTKGIEGVTFHGVPTENEAESE